MAYRQIDPARLEGDALTRWYLRSPDDIEQERQDAAAQRYQDFFGGNRNVAADSTVDDGFRTADSASEPVSGANSGSPIQDVDPGFTWVSDGPNRFRSVATSSDQGGTSPEPNPAGTAPAGATFDGAGAESRVAVGNALPGTSVAVPSARSSVSAPRATPGAIGPSYRRPTAPLPPTIPSHSFVHRPAQTPFGSIADAFHDWQHGPKMQRPNLAESFIPVVGPAWEAAADLQDGNYGGAAFNGVMAVADALPIGVAAKGFKAATKGIGILKEGSVTADAARKVLRRVGMAKPGQEIHHSVPLDGLGRNVQDWRNHYAFLKPLPKDIHRRLTGSWMGKPEFDPIRKVWHGTTDWQKAVPAGIAGYAADAWENLTHPFGSPAGGTPNPNREP